VKRILLSVSAIALLLSLFGCRHDINNKEALRAAVIEHLTARQGQIGLSMDMMEVEVGSMSFQKDQATATISFKPKAGGEGMQIPYAFERKGDKWAVRSRMETGPGGHGAGQAAPPPTGEAAPTPGGALPPGHPTTGTPTGPLPPGHPKVGAAKK
jgi:hypothetical protein